MFEQYTDPETYAKIVDWKSVSAMWNDSVQKYADRPAVEDGETALTYAELEARAAVLRGALQQQGVKKGDRVGLYAPNGCAFAAAYLAIVTGGAVAALLPPQLPGAAVAGLSRMFGLKLLVADATLSANLPEQMPVPVIGTDAEAEPTDAIEVEAKDPCVIMFTGGTTGQSKGAILSNGAVMTGTKYGCYGIKEIFDQRYFLVLPLTHVFGLIRNLMCTLYTGSVIHICRNTKDMFREIAVFRPTVWVVVPALAEMALNLSRQFKRNMLGDSLKTVICGAAAVAPYLVREYHKLGIELYPGYGLTESANLVSGNPDNLNRPESVGLPFPGQELKIVDGELWLKGPNMMDGYINPQDNAAAYEDGWFKTGDLARFDADGYLYITGRTKEVIVLSNGENVSPAEVEAKFNELETVQDSLVSADGDALMLEVVPRNTVLLSKGLEDPIAYLREQLNAVNRTLPTYQRVSKIVIRDTDFKRSPSMKILRNQK